MLKIFHKISSNYNALNSRLLRSFASNKEGKVASLAIEPEEDLYETYLKDDYKRLYQESYQSRIPGHATLKGTKSYSLRRDIVNEKHFRQPYYEDLNLSSVGIGTYVGSPDEVDDLKMFNAIIESVQSGGVNVIDTAINYRYQKSERVVGAALRYLIEKGFQREELFICSKNGYIPVNYITSISFKEDADRGISSQMIISKLIEQGKVNKIVDISDIFQIKEEDILGACHSIHPNFLEDQLENSLSNIGIQCLDLYYLHNAAESEMSLLGHSKFMNKLAAAFEFCEKKVLQGKIKSYGLASWVCFRAKPEEKDLHLSIQETADLAKKIGGSKHHFRFIQLPSNLAMPESFAEKWQPWTEGGKTIYENVFQVARRNRINVITSSPLAQGLMIQVPLSTDLFKCSNLGAKHIQFSRSLPAEALTCTLIGQKTARHVKKNLEVIQYPPLTIEEFMEFLKPTKRVAKPDEAVDMDD